MALAEVTFPFEVRVIIITTAAFRRKALVYSWVKENGGKEHYKGAFPLQGSVLKGWSSHREAFPMMQT